jgi:hypothetical protein
LKAGTLDHRIVKTLKSYARGINEDARTYAREILNEAGVSWEKAEK